METIQSPEDLSSLNVFSSSHHMITAQIWDTLHIGLSQLSFTAHYDFAQPGCLSFRCEEKKIKGFQAEFD